MNIVAKDKKFPDYYDGIAAKFLDKTITFVRKTRKEKVPESIIYSKDLLHTDERNETPKGKFNYRIIPILIGFCGKVYPALRVEKKDPKAYYEDYPHERWIKDTVYSKEEFEMFFTTKKHGFMFDGKRREYRWSSLEYSTTPLMVKKFFEDYKVTNKHVGLFHEIGAPIFIIGPDFDESDGRCYGGCYRINNRSGIILKSVEKRIM